MRARAGLGAVGCIYLTELCPGSGALQTRLEGVPNACGCSQAGVPNAVLLPGVLECLSLPSERATCRLWCEDRFLRATGRMQWLRTRLDLKTELLEPSGDFSCPDNTQNNGKQNSLDGTM